MLSEKNKKLFVINGLNTDSKKSEKYREILNDGFVSKGNRNSFLKINNLNYIEKSNHEHDHDKNNENILYKQALTLVEYVIIVWKAN